MLAISGCGGGGNSTTTGTAVATTGEGGTPAAESAKVDIADYKYNPPTVTIRSGGTITWTNSDSAPHTATDQDGGRFDTHALNRGQSKTLTFSAPGTYPYVCLFHPFMHGTVTVVG